MRCHMKKILLYSECHEPYLETFVTILKLLNDSKIFIATGKKRHDWLLSANPELYTDVNFINLKEKFPVEKNPVKAITSVLNNYEIIKNFIEKEKVSEFIILELYNEKLKLLMSLNFPFKNVHSILTVHNIHDYFEVDETLLKSYNLNKVRKYQKKFVRNFDKIVVLADRMKDFLKVNYGIEPYTMPYKLTKLSYIEKRNNFLNDKTLTSKVKFVVPGNVDSKRKDYYSIIDSFSRYDKNKYELVFLGKVIEEKILKYGKTKNINIKSFKSYIPENLFNDEIINSHFVIGFSSGLSPYGILKASGIEFDGPALGVPTIVNNENLMSEKGVFLFTENLQATLDQLFCDFENNEYLEKYGKSAFEKMKNNTADKYLKNIKSLLEADK